MAGDLDCLDAGPRARLHGEALRDMLLMHWPSLTDSDILDSEAHLGKLAATISKHTGEA